MSNCYKCKHSGTDKCLTCEFVDRTPFHRYVPIDSVAEKMGAPENDGGGYSLAAVQSLRRFASEFSRLPFFERLTLLEVLESGPDVARIMRRTRQGKTAVYNHLRALRIHPFFGPAMKTFDALFNDLGRSPETGRGKDIVGGGDIFPGGRLKNGGPSRQQPGGSGGRSRNSRGKNLAPNLPEKRNKKK